MEQEPSKVLLGREGAASHWHSNTGPDPHTHPHLHLHQHQHQHQHIGTPQTNQGPSRAPSASSSSSRAAEIATAGAASASALAPRASGGHGPAEDARANALGVQEDPLSSSSSTGSRRPMKTAPEHAGRELADVSSAAPLAGHVHRQSGDRPPGLGLVASGAAAATIPKIITTATPPQTSPSSSPPLADEATTAVRLVGHNEARPPSSTQARGLPQAPDVAGSADGKPSPGAHTPVGKSVSPKAADSDSKAKPKKPLRRGKWTLEEELYVQKIIHDFNTGMLPVPAGTTLRSYLSEKLNCDPMRITKKFTGDACIGKRVFHPLAPTALNEHKIQEAHATLQRLENQWLAKLEEQKKEAERKSKKGYRSGSDSDGDMKSMFLDDPRLEPSRKTRGEAMRWLQQAQEALKKDASLLRVEELLASGNALSAHFSSVVDLADGKSPASYRYRRDSGVATHGGAASSLGSPKRRRLHDDMEDAGDLLVGFLCSLRETKADLATDSKP